MDYSTWLKKSEKNEVNNMEFKIREIEAKEYSILEKFLYEALYVPEGQKKFPYSIINEPDLQVYIDNFGEREGDTGFIAIYQKEIIGAAWGRIMDDYGHIDDETPSLAISVLEDYRSRGAGMALMKSLLEALKNKRYQQVSLSVQKSNYAVHMYRQLGFKVFSETEEEFIMLCDLSEWDI